MAHDDQNDEIPDINTVDNGEAAEVGSDGLGHAEEVGPHAQDTAGEGAEDILQPDTKLVERVDMEEESAPDGVEAVDPVPMPVVSDNEALMAVSLAQVGAASAAMINIPIGAETAVDVEPSHADELLEGVIELVRMPNGRPVLLSRAALDTTSLSQMLAAVTVIVRRTVQEYNTTKKEDAFLPRVVNDAHYQKAAAEIATMLWRGQNTQILNTVAGTEDAPVKAVEIDAAYVVNSLCQRPDIETHAATIRVALQTGGSISYALLACLRYLDAVAQDDGDGTPITDMLAKRLSI